MAKPNTQRTPQAAPEPAQAAPALTIVSSDLTKTEPAQAGGNSDGALAACETAILGLMRDSAANKAQGESYVSTLSAKLPDFLEALADKDMLAKHKKGWRFEYAFAFSTARDGTWTREEALAVWNDKPAKAWPESLRRGERSASTLISEAFKLAKLDAKTGAVLPDKPKEEKPETGSAGRAEGAGKSEPAKTDAPEDQGKDVAEIISVADLVKTGERKAKALLQVEKRDAVHKALEAVLAGLHALEQASLEQASA